MARAFAGAGGIEALTFGEKEIAMRQLFATIRTLVGEDKYIVGKHAAERLEERGIME